jgi:hypothetical protein
LKQQRIKAMDTGLLVALVVILQIIVIVLAIIGVRYRLIRKQKKDADDQPRISRFPTQPLNLHPETRPGTGQTNSDRPPWVRREEREQEAMSPSEDAAVTSRPGSTNPQDGNAAQD